MNVEVENCGPGVYPSVVSRRDGYRGFTPIQRRTYADGLTMLVEESIYGTRMATVWIERDGLNGGRHGRVVNSPSDIGALYCGFRRGLAKIGLYPIFNADGSRNLGNGPVAQEGNVYP